MSVQLDWTIVASLDFTGGKFAQSNANSTLGWEFRVSKSLYGPNLRFTVEEAAVPEPGTLAMACAALLPLVISCTISVAGVRPILADSELHRFPLGELDILLHFDKYRNNEMAKKIIEDQVARYADMFSAIGTEPRLRILRLLLSAHPNGLTVGEIGTELAIPGSTLSHHLEKLKNEDLVSVRRESTYLWYSANTAALQDLLGFLYAECCTRNQAILPSKIVTICK